MTITVTNDNLVDTNTPVSPATLAYPSNPTINDGLLVSFQCDSTATVNTPTDTLTNSYSLLAHGVGTDSTFDVYIWLCKKNKSTGANTVSVSFSGTISFAALRISEISDGAGNASGFNSDQTQTSTSPPGGSANPTLTTGTTTVANELVYGSMVNGGSNGTVGSGYASIRPGVNDSGQDEWKTVTSTGTQVVNFTATSAGWTMAAATIFTVSVAAPSVPLGILGFVENEF